MSVEQFLRLRLPLKVLDSCLFRAFVSILPWTLLLLPHMKRRSTSPIIRGMQIKASSCLLEWWLPNRQEITRVAEEVEERDPWDSVDRDVNWCSHYGKQHGDSSKKLRIELSYNPAINFWVFIHRILKYQFEKIYVPLCSMQHCLQ